MKFIYTQVDIIKSESNSLISVIRYMEINDMDTKIESKLPFMHIIYNLLIRQKKKV